MAEEAPAAAPVKSPETATAKAKGSTTRKRSTVARTGNRMTLGEQILEVIVGFKQPKGVSVSAIKKALTDKGVEMSKQNNRVNVAIRRLENEGQIVRVTGTGASGSFKLPKKEPKKDTRKSKPRNALNKSPPRKPAGKKDKVNKPRIAKKEGQKNKKVAAKKAAKKTSAKKPVKKTAAKMAPKKPAQKRAKPSPKKSGKVTPKKQGKPVQKKMAQKKSAASKKSQGKGKK